MHEWEMIKETEGDGQDPAMMRLEVPGGWIYRMRGSAENALVFVSDPNVMTVTMTDHEALNRIVQAIEGLRPV